MRGSSNHLLIASVHQLKLFKSILFFIFELYFHFFCPEKHPKMFNACNFNGKTKNVLAPFCDLPDYTKKFSKMIFSTILVCGILFRKEKLLFEF